MREPVIFEKVVTLEQWRELELFAASFNHKVDKTSLTPAVTVRRAGGRIFAYFFLMTFPVIMPSFHPDKISPRDFVDTVDQIRSWAWMSSLGNERFPKGVCWAAFDINPVINRETIEKLGFRSTNCELWQSYPEIIEEVGGS